MRVVDLVYMETKLGGGPDSMVAETHYCVSPKHRPFLGFLVLARPFCWSRRPLSERCPRCGGKVYGPLRMLGHASSHQAPISNDIVAVRVS